MIGGGLFLTVLGLFALGLAAIIRHTAGAITTFVAILLILPLVVSAFPAKIGWPIGRYLPATIGSAMTSMTSLGRARRSCPPSRSGTASPSCAPTPSAPT